MDEGGLWKWSVFLYGNFARGTWREDSFIWDPEGNVKEGSRNRYLSSFGPCWGTVDGGAAFPRTFRERRDFILSGGLVYWGLWEICKRRFWKRAALSIGALLGNLERGSFYQGL